MNLIAEISHFGFFSVENDWFVVVWDLALGFGVNLILEEIDVGKGFVWEEIE